MPGNLGWSWPEGGPGTKALHLDQLPSWTQLVGDWLGALDSIDPRAPGGGLLDGEAKGN